MIVAGCFEEFPPILSAVLERTNLADNPPGMIRIRVTLPLFLMLAHGLIGAESQPSLWRFVGPDAKVLIGIDWSRVRQSQAGAMIRKEWIPQDKLAGFPALELLDSVDRILISSAAGNAADNAVEVENPGDLPILIAIQGHFEATRVRELFEHTGAKRQAYDSFQVYRPQSKPNSGMAFVLFDAQTILYGQAAGVFAALDRNRYAAPAADAGTPGSVVARAAALEARYEIWAMLDAGEVLSNDGIANLFGADAAADAARGFEVGLNLHAGLDADFIIHFTSDEIAKRLTADLSRAVAAAAHDKSVDAQAQNVARKLKFSVDGSMARISLRLSEQEFERTAQVFTGTAKAGQRVAANAAFSPAQAPVQASAAAVAAPVSKPGVIRIEGLDDGPREIPYPEH